MRKILVISMAVILSSCGTFKKFKNKQEQKSVTKVDSSALVITQNTRKVDTSITLKGSQQYASKPVDNIVRGGDSLVLDNDQQRIVVDYDPTTGNIRAKGTVKDRQERVQVQETFTRAEQTEKKAETKQEVKHVKTDTFANNDGFAWGVAFTVIGILLLIVALMELRRRFFL